MARSNRFTIPLAVALLLAALAPAAAIAQQSFSATHYAVLTTDEETQQVDDFGSGIAIFRVDPASSTVEYRVTVTGVENITGAHIHRGASGVDGPVVAPIGITNNSLTTTGVLSNVRSSFMDSLLLGNAYVNVHSSTYPAGHIRGQIVQIPNAGATDVSASQEPHTVQGDTGVGTAIMWIDPNTRRAVYLLAWESLSGPATAAHFHLGAPNVAGPPIHTITVASPNAVTAVGIWMMSPEHYAALLAGDVYVNVHTAVNQEGEIRGQIAPIDVFTAALSSANEIPSLAGQSSAAGTAIFLVERLGELGGYVYGSAVVEQTTGDITAAHIHAGTATENGDPIVPLEGDLLPAEFMVQDSVSSEDLEAMRNSATYVNVHTAQFANGEARGQLIPAATNLGTNVTAVPVLPGAITGAALAARYDRAGDAVQVTISGVVPGPQSTVALYSLEGSKVAEVAVDRETVELPAAGLSSGGYLARLILGGRPSIAGRVVIVR